MLKSQQTMVEIDEDIKGMTAEREKKMRQRVEVRMSLDLGLLISV